MSGFYLMSRGWQKNDVFGNEPYSQRDAWQWMIEEAFFKPGQKRIGGQMHDVARGEFIHSLRFLGDAWKWKKDRVARFLGVLRDARMIRVESATGSATAERRITICNYDKYQMSCDSDASANETTTRQQRDNDATDYKERKELKENTTATTGAGANAVSQGDAVPHPSTRLSVGAKVLALMGLTIGDPRWYGNLGRVEAWVNSGADPEADIYPTITRLTEAKRQTDRQWLPKSLSYFDGAIADAVRDRTSKLEILMETSHGSSQQANSGQRKTTAQLLAERHPGRFGNGVAGSA